MRFFITYSFVPVSFIFITANYSLQGILKCTLAITMATNDMSSAAYSLQAVKAMA